MQSRVNRIALRVALHVLSKARPEDLFAGAFFDLREKVKALKKQWAQEAMASLQKTLIKGLTDAGYEGVTAELSLGQYRGSQFITSAKVSVKVGTEAKAKKLAGELLQYSPKFHLKEFDQESGVANYNIR